MYRFPDPLDETSLKGLIADKRFQDPRHPEHEFFKKFVAKAFELVHPDSPRDGAGRAVLDPREPSAPQVVRGGEEFKSEEPSSRELGTFQSIGAAHADGSSAPASYRRDASIGPVTQTPLLRQLDKQGDGYFGAPRDGKDHKGSDMRAKKGDSIRSPVDGVVISRASIRTAIRRTEEKGSCPPYKSRTTMGAPFGCCTSMATKI